jgi:hypothetical protein
MARQFEIPLIYTNRGKPPKHRNVANYPVLATAVFEFREVEDWEMPIAVSFVHDYENSDGTPGTYREDYRELDGKLLRKVPGLGPRFDASVMREAGLASLREAGRRKVPDHLIVDSTRFHYNSSDAPFDETDLKPHHVMEDGRAGAVAELQDKIASKTALLDGVLWGEATEPVWKLWIAHGEVSVSADMRGDGHFNFPYDQSDQALEFADWVADRHRYRLVHKNEFRFEIPPESNAPVFRNPLLDAVDRFANLADLNIINAAPWGEDVKETGTAYVNERTVENALSFMERFEEAALRPGAPRIRPFFDGDSFEVFRAFAELVPERFKRGTDTISIHFDTLPDMAGSLTR